MIKRGFRVKAKFSSTPVYKAMARQKDLWKCTGIKKQIVKPKIGGNAAKTAWGKSRQDDLRHKTTTYHFDFVWKP